MRFQVSLFAVLAGLSGARAQQGTADAIVVKIAGANLPSSVTLSAPGGNGFPGKNVTIPLTLSLLGTTAPSSFQADLVFDSTNLTFVSASGLSSSVVSAGDVRLSYSGAMQNGVIGSVTLALATSFEPAPLAFANCKSIDALRNPLSTGCVAGNIELLSCDVTGDGIVAAADVRMLVNEALGVASPVHDMNQDGVVNVTDIQRVTAAVLGKGCLY